jgi:SAM-dependent methyltransferase
MKIFTSFTRSIKSLFLHLGVFIWLVRNVQEIKDLDKILANSPDSPNSAMSPWQGVTLTVQSSATTVLRLRELSKLSPLAIITFETLKSKVEASSSNDIEKRLRYLMDLNGSDKGNSHQYTYLYALIFSEFEVLKEARILEIGLGTNNVDTPSNMGVSGKPGASIRAFRDYDRKVTCVGLDVDHRVLFEEERIQTAVVDQMQLDSWNEIPKHYLMNKFDLVIDDGLHSPTANLNTILSTIDLLTERGVIVVEDIAERALDIWNLLATLGIEGFEIKMVRFPNSYCAVIAKTGVTSKFLD